jgi:uncharacterized protein
MSEANVRIMEQFFAATRTRDPAAIYPFLADDVVVHEPPALPYGGDHHGKAGVVTLLETIEAIREQIGAELRVLDAGSDQVVALLKCQWIMRATGARITLRIGEVYTMRDGKVADIEVYFWDASEVEREAAGVNVHRGSVRVLEDG